jgi:hypothetical protein
VLAGPEHSELAHSLRSGLDTRKAQIKVLFAGSSEAALREMFSRAAAPFYNWAPVEPFPLLGREFVVAMVKQLSKVARHPLKLDDALKAYAALKETPEFFRWYIERYVMYQAQGPEQALAYTRARVHDDTNYAKTWKELGRADRGVLLLAARGVQDLYGAAALDQLRELLGSKDPNANVIRASIRRLTSITAPTVSRIRNSRPGWQRDARWTEAGPRGHANSTQLVRRDGGGPTRHPGFRSPSVRAPPPTTTCSRSTPLPPRARREWCRASG